MLKTKFFTKFCAWNNPVETCNELIIQKETFINSNKNKIGNIDSEDLKVESTGNNHAICILKISYYEK